MAVDLSNDAEERAIDLAVLAHRGQKYGQLPYIVHPASVRQVLADFGCHGDLGVAAWLHDVPEDTAFSVEVQANFSTEVFGLVWAVTGVGTTRKERNESAYKKLRDKPEAIVLKLADRIANAESCKKNNPKLLEMYRAEQQRFNAVVGTVAPAMMTRLRNAFT